MRVVTFNIRHGAPPGGCPDIDALARTIAGMNADAVALQEVDRRVFRSGFTDQTARIAERTGLVSQFGRARRIGPMSGYGNALLTRTEPSRVDVLELRSLGEQRVAVIAEVVTDEGPATLVSVHLQNRRSGQPPQALSQLDQLLDVVSCRPEPWVVMGDFNLRPEIVLPKLAEAGLSPASVEPTFPAVDPRIAIDWIAVRGMNVVSVDLPDVRLSDHRPLVVDLQDSRTPNFAPTGAEG
ncbi:MAG: endonuclease/exonuclease/phosphatase family protein [Microthrixaceae bacterium]